MRQARFPLGQLLATPGALAALDAAGESPASFLSRHMSGDWGELDQEDRAANELSARQGFRILSAYTLRGE